VTSIYLQGIDPGDIIETARPPTAHDPRQRRPRAPLRRLIRIDTAAVSRSGGAAAAPPQYGHISRSRALLRSVRRRRCRLLRARLDCTGGYSRYSSACPPSGSPSARSNCFSGSA
jgi:hypothetical protein